MTQGIGFASDSLSRKTRVGLLLSGRGSEGVSLVARSAVGASLETPLSVWSKDSPWQELERAHVGQLDTGAVLDCAVKSRDLREVVQWHSD